MPSSTTICTLLSNGFISDKKIKRVASTKSLGVMVDECLNGDDQCKIVKSKICGGLASLKKLENILPQSKLGSVYYTVAESLLRYADVIWGSLPARKIKLPQNCRIELS